MFCSNCGKELPDGSKFCNGCGSPQSITPNVTGIQQSRSLSDNQAPKDEVNGQEQKAGLKILLAALVAMLLIAIGIMAFLVVKRRMVSDDGEVVVTVSDKAEKSDGTETDTAPSDSETDSYVESDEVVPITESPEDIAARGALFVGVPTASMALRTNPGLGDDIINEYSAGVLFEYSGMAQMVEDREFYQVIELASGQKGFVAADYCTPVSFVYDDSNLTIVDTSEALYDYADMVSDLEELSSVYGDILNYSSVGTSVDGREIYKVILGNPNASDWIMIQAGIHGREYMSTQLVMRLMEYYAYYYKNGGSYNGISYQDLLNQTALVIVPMSNPDGIAISQYGEAGLNNPDRAYLLRECYERDKNSLILELDTNDDWNWADHYQDENFDRSTATNQEMITYETYLTLWKSNANGVDLNTNFDAGWEEVEKKAEPAYTSYKGSYALSEPESQILNQIALERDYKYYISYHAKGQLIYYDAKGNLPEVTAQSQNLANAVYEINKYKLVNTQKGYNVTLGGFGDWIQLKLNKPSVTVEIGKHPCPLGIEEFPAIFLRNREVWAKLCNM